MTTIVSCIPARSLVLLAALFALLHATAATAGKGLVHNEGGVAINGYDAVAYFSQSKAVAGESAYSHAWRGVSWRFSSAANRDRFAADPEKSAPQYGGYCAFAASKNAIAPTDPQAWTVHDGKLYLNYSKNVRGIWQQDIPGNVELGDGNWPGLKNRL